MKKLNKKGFTLIELLAVIVILAIIVVVTVPTILNSINDARLSSIHSLSKEVANWYDTSAAQDVIAIDNTKILKGANENVSPTTWKCLGEVMGTMSGATTTSLADLYGLSSNDLVLTGTAPANDLFHLSGEEIGFITDAAKVPADMCSAIRLMNNRAWVILVAKDNGKFDTNGSIKTYAASFGSNGFDGEV